MKRVAFLNIAALCVASFFVVSMQFYFYVQNRIELARSADNLADIEATRASEQLVVQLRKVERYAEALAKELGAGNMSQEAIALRLKEARVAHPNILALDITASPQEEMGEAISGGKPGWTGLYRDKASNELATAYVVPIGSGALYIVISTDTIREIAGAFKFGDTGYGYILSKKGTFVYHPIDAAVESQKTIFELSSEHKTAQAAHLLDVTKKALSGQHATLNITNPATSQNFKLFYHPIPETGWVLGAVFSKDEMLMDGGFFRKEKMWIVLGLIFFLSLLAAVVFRVDTVKSSRMWLVSSAFSILCIAGAFYIWHLTLSAPTIEEKDKRVFTDMVSLSRFMESNDRAALKMNKRPPAYVPTGIYVQSLEFTGSNDLAVTGYVWQKYTDGVHDKLQRGFVMPEARTLEVTESYRRKSGKTETIGWYFEATIRQQFDYSRYPFDRPNIWIWLRPADFTGNIVLVPDLASYKFLAPSSLPGLQEEAALPGYTFLGTFFDHEYHIRRTSFGVASRRQSDRMPELYYNIIVKRNFITPFVSKLFPLFIMFSILFVVQLMFSQDEEKKKAFGLSAFAVMGVIITFFFSTLLSHTGLRQELGSERIIFIENFHFIAYMMLLLVTIKTLLFIGGKRVSFVQYKNGLIPKLLYWPLFTGFVFVVSFVHFY